MLLSSRVHVPCFMAVICMFVIISGGVQLQPFKSNGRRTEAKVNVMTLGGATSVYVTIIAENAAGLTVPISSQPLTRAPPHVCCVIVNAFCVNMKIFRV